jgi:hypothetical protein
MIGSEQASVFGDREIFGDWRVEKFDEDKRLRSAGFYRPQRPSTCDQLRQPTVWNQHREGARAVPAQTVNRYTGPPMTLGAAAAARVRLIVWCRDCRHQIEPDPAEMAERYGAELSVPDWHRRLMCSACGSRQIDFVVTGAK